MSEEKPTASEIELDFDRLARVGSKINELLMRKTKGSAEAYAVLRFLCVRYEEDLGIKFQREFEEELHKTIRNNLLRKEPEPESKLTKQKN